MYTIGAGRVFYRGQKVGGANAATFRVIGPGVGADARAVFWNEFKELGLDPAGIEAIGGNYFRAPHGVLHGVGLVEGADAASLVVLADDYASDRRAVFFRRQTIADADVETFVPLDVFYSKDARRVYFRNQPIEDADPPTFEVVDRNGRDRFRVYDGPFGAARIAEPTSQEVPSVGLETIARRLTAKRIEILFPVFDEVQSNDDADAIRASFEQPPRAADSVDFTMTVDGALLTIECDGHVLAASFAGYLTALGALWGIARKKVIGSTPCVRMVDERGVLVSKGDVLIRQTTRRTLPDLFDACELLARSGHLEEAELVAYQLDNGVAYMNTAEGRTYALRLQQLRAAYRLEIHERSALRCVDATTAHAVMKKLTASSYPLSPHALERVAVAERFHRLVEDVFDGDPIRFNDAAILLLPLLHDSHPLVRDLMWQSLDFFVSKLFLHHEYQLCLEHVSVLIARGINLDINLARRWECLRAAGRDAEAEQDWNALLSMTSERDRAPRQHPGLHTDYPNYFFWQVGGYLRLGTADAIAIAAQHITKLADRYNAFVSGPVLGNLLVDLNERVKLWDYGTNDYVMHLHYVEHVLTKRPYELNAVDVRRSGLYRKDRGPFFDLMSSSDHVAPAIGQAYGIEYRLAGAPLCRTVPTTIRVYRRQDPDAPDEHPPLATYESVSYVGMDNAFYWVFDEAGEIAPAFWTIDIAIDPEGPRPLETVHRFEVRGPS
jgi:DKNYY family protein